MLLDGGGSNEVNGWQATTSHNARTGASPEWKRVHAQLEALAQQYVTLDAQLTRWLREAQRVKVWKHCGRVSMADYLEHVFGFSPRQARERLLVARRLGDLPVLEAALGRGELPYTAVRELSRVALPSTESAWVEHARGKCLRQIEEAVTQRDPGDLPSDPPRPDASAPLRIAFDVTPETYALFLQVRQVLEDERGSALEGDALLAAMLDAVVAPADAEARKGRAKFQIAITTCQWCQRASQHGGGRSYAIGRAALERATCDSQCIGSLDNAPARATQDVPPRIRRLVMQRDGYCCRVPGCRSARFLEVHHIVARADGGTNDPSNLTLLCDGHHTQHHEGWITIGGRAPDQVTFHAGSRWDGGVTRMPMDDPDPFPSRAFGRGAAIDRQ